LNRSVLRGETVVVLHAACRRERGGGREEEMREVGGDAGSGDG